VSGICDEAADIRAKRVQTFITQLPNHVQVLGYVSGQCPFAKESDQKQAVADSEATTAIAPFVRTAALTIASQVITHVALARTANFKSELDFAMKTANGLGVFMKELPTKLVSALKLPAGSVAAVSPEASSPRAANSSPLSAKPLRRLRRKLSPIL
jgi:hypothetical protein